MKKEFDRVAALMADIGSPRIVAAIDEALADNAAEREELVDLRKMAVRRHGDATDAPGKTEASQTNLSLTVAELADRYRTDERSGLHQVRHATRENYKGLLRRLEAEIGPEKVSALTADRLQALFDDWSQGGERIPMARGLITILRILASFGATVLESRDCRELKFTVHEMRFERPEPLTGGDRRLSLFQAKNIITKANELNFHSIALAQAFQIDCGLKQKDVIGEWIPVGDPGEGVATSDDGMKSVRGLVWQEIHPGASDDAYLLRHAASWSGQVIEKILAPDETPLVWPQLKLMYPTGLPNKGPVIISEDTGQPYKTHNFRRTWRKIAIAAGVPRNVMNRDSA